MNRSVLIATALAVVILGYFGVRSLMRGSISSQTEVVQERPVEARPEAITLMVSAERHPLSVTAKGRTAPDKSVTVKSGTTGTVVSTPATEGAFVRKGTLLCGLDIEARNARVREAEAMRDSAKVDYDAAKTLASKGLTPANRVASAKASLDAAEASVNTAKVELARTQIRAPFDGIFETQIAEAGDYLGPGAPCGVVVDMSPVILAAEVTEADAGGLAAGMPVTATLADGRTFPGKLRYVSRSASPQTRTFLIEAELETGDAIVAAGVTASVAIPVGDVPATLVSPALLTLSDTGQLGVRYVEAGNMVRFAPVTVIDETPQGAWVTGLPETTQLISMGQDYLSEGVHVTPVPAGGAQP